MALTWPTPSPDAAANETTGHRPERRILAVGTPGGVTSGFADLPDGGGLVRLGRTLLSLSEYEYKLWDASQAAPTAGPLLEQAVRAGVADPPAVLAELEAARLVTTYADEPSSTRSLAAALSIRLTGRLIGNGPHRSPQFLVAAVGATRQLRVDVVVYQVLLWADGRASIAGLCAKIDTEKPDPAFDAEKHVVGWIPSLMRAGLIGLDLTDPPDGGSG
jgi:hypothetical protein